jgi:hypothetical protein
MKLTANPFDAQTGELLPVYEEAYLRGDLTRASTQAVENHLSRDAHKAHRVVTHWHQLAAADQATAPTWVRKQLRFMQQQPRRIQRRMLGLGTGGVLLVGAVLARPHVPSPPLATGPVASVEVGEPAASPAGMVTLHGRILDEKGHPLPGATVLQKGTTTGTSTDASGSYSLRVPARGTATLQYGYGGYAEQELSAGQAAATGAIVLQPKAPRHRYWAALSRLWHG